MFRYLPVNVRLRIVKNHLGPAPGWPMKARVEGKVPMLLGYSIAQAVASNGACPIFVAVGGWQFP